MNTISLPYTLPSMRLNMKKTASCLPIPILPFLQGNQNFSRSYWLSRKKAQIPALPGTKGGHVTRSVQWDVSGKDGATSRSCSWSKAHLISPFLLGWKTATVRTLLDLQTKTGSALLQPEAHVLQLRGLDPLDPFKLARTKQTNISLFQQL